jgi:hypothetical protein
MPAFQLTRAETARRDDLLETLRSLDEQIEDANNDILTAIEERDRSVGQFNDAADAARVFFAEIAGRMNDDDDDYSDSASTLKMLEVSQVEEMELKLNVQLDYDAVFAEFDALVEFEDESEPA